MKIVPTYCILFTKLFIVLMRELDVQSLKSDTRSKEVSLLMQSHALFLKQGITTIDLSVIIGGKP